MSMEDIKGQLDAKEFRTDEKRYLFREMLEQLIGTLVRLDREAHLRVGYDHCVGVVCGYRNGCNPAGVHNTSDSLNSLASQISNSVGTPLYLNTINRGQRNSEVKLNVVTE